MFPKIQNCPRLKTIALDYTQKKMRKEWKHFTIKKTDTRDNAGNEGQNYKVYKKQIAE